MEKPWAQILSGSQHRQLYCLMRIKDIAEGRIEE
jgi:hypothetical protein